MLGNPSNSSNPSKLPALHRAALAGDFKEVKRLINQEENVNFKVEDPGNHNASVPLHFAIVGFINVITAKKSSIEQTEQTVEEAIEKTEQYNEIVELLLNKGAHVEEKHPDGNTPLCFAVMSLCKKVVRSKTTGENIRIVELLLAKKANTEEITKDGLPNLTYTPLCYAAVWNRFDLARVLIDYNAKIEVQAEKSGLTLIQKVEKRKKFDEKFSNMLTLLENSQRNESIRNSIKEGHDTADSSGSSSASPSTTGNHDPRLFGTGAGGSSAPVVPRITCASVVEPDESHLPSAQGGL